MSLSPKDEFDSDDIGLENGQGSNAYEFELNTNEDGGVNNIPSNDDNSNNQFVHGFDDKMKLTDGQKHAREEYLAMKDDARQNQHNPDAPLIEGDHAGLSLKSFYRFVKGFETAAAADVKLSAVYTKFNYTDDDDKFIEDVRNIHHQNNQGNRHKKMASRMVQGVTESANINNPDKEEKRHYWLIILTWSIFL
ncbi:hypothetical protein SNEBB_002448 [Seison nebaliae]|nr:hypothetical protein SNEBB_002448 [Seison nebaliae]